MRERDALCSARPMKAAATGAFQKVADAERRPEVKPSAVLCGEYVLRLHVHEVPVAERRWSHQC